MCFPTARQAKHQEVLGRIYKFPLCITGTAGGAGAKGAAPGQSWPGFSRRADEWLSAVAQSGRGLGTDAEAESKVFLADLLQKMAQRFRSFLILELHEGAMESTEFVVSGPCEKLPATLNALADGLGQIEARYGAELSARISDVTHSNPGHAAPLFDAENLRALGGTWIGLEVPPAYRDGEGTEFPVYFRKFRNRFAETVQEALFEFIRVQTTSNMASYHALGKREIHEEVLKIDKRITDIQNSYSFLLLVAPINISELKERYFNNGFKNVGTYHYRLLPIDPDILKRKLYNLDIHEIDDPALAYVYDEKREEIDHELTMLKERGSQNFFYSSIRMYGSVSDRSSGRGPNYFGQGVRRIRSVTSCRHERLGLSRLGRKGIRIFQNNGPRLSKSGAHSQRCEYYDGIAGGAVFARGLYLDRNGGTGSYTA